MAVRMHFDAGAPRGTTIATPLAVSIRDLLMSAAAIAVVIALIALTDDRVRERIAGVNTGSVAHRVVNGTNQVESATVSVREIVAGNWPLTLLVIAGGVLFVCMLRT